MEIRLLSSGEVQWAADTANEVFSCCVQNYVKTQDAIAQFYRYTSIEYLCKEVDAGRLLLWGAFEAGQMCAVSAIQNVGHITMLYVKPYAQRRRIGSQLLGKMQEHAFFVWHLSRVTINVMPVSAVSYFYRMGFAFMSGAVGNQPYVSLECRIVQRSAYNPDSRAADCGGWFGAASDGGADNMCRTEDAYPIRQVSTRTVLLVTTIVLFLSFVIGGTVTILHMSQGQVSDGVDYEFFKQERLGESEKVKEV